MEIEKCIDHTFLKPAGDKEAVKKLCAEAKACGFASVCVNPCEVETCARILRKSPVKVCTVIDFPLGQGTNRTRCFEALDAIQAGADELDLVVNQRLLKYAPGKCQAELLQWVRTCRTIRSDVTLKLILECCNLTKKEIALGCKIAQKVGFDFVKTSTGFAASGATVEDVALMRRTVGPDMGVKAAGGIRDRKTALAMLAAGATRLGSSAGMNMKRIMMMAAALAGALTVYASRVEVFPQSFEAGGWGLDAGLMDVIGSPHLIAHGMGRPVPDATARIVFPEAGAWRVFVRSKNWADGAPGKFSLLVNGAALKHVFGEAQRAWAWEDGGTVEVKAGAADLALRDLTGFDGRCAGIVFTKGDEPVPTGALDVRGREPDETRDFGFVVVGGGMPGCCAAIAAARAGIRVALVQDRPVLGGNASSEIRVWCGGESRHPIVDELRGLFMNRNQLAVESDKTRLATLQREQNLSVFLLHRAFGVEKQGAAIASVKALNLADNRIVRFRAPLFCDATGDGWVGTWAGADLRYGREAKGETGEASAVEKADRTVLGASLMWESANANDDVPFSAPWAERFAESGPAVNGEWNWEYGLDRDMITEAEEIRDRLLLAIYGAFSKAKKDPVNSRRMIVTCPYVLGKRESRRILGDWILKEDDIVAKTPFADAIATGSWSIDLHFTIKAAPYLTDNTHPMYGRYWIPYRTIYSRNVDNLFVVGRCFSCTHVGLGSPRVINTLSQLGVAAGTAAAMCREAKCNPRRIFADGKCRELQRRIGGDWPGNPDPAKKGWTYVDDESPDTVRNGKWAQDFCWNGGQFGDKASWSFGPETGGSVVYKLPVARKGRYRLYGKVPYDWTITRCDRVAEIKVTSEGRAKALSWNQSLQTGRWLAIAELELAPGATLELAPSKQKGVTITADGYALEPLN